MKKYIIAFTAVNALSLVLSLNTMAKGERPSSNLNSEKVESSIFSIEKDEINVSRTMTSSVAAKALKNFSHNFKNMPNAEWYATNSGDFLASFTEENVKTTVYYNGKGKFEGTIKRYDENEMAASLRRQVKNIYFDYNILAIEELETTSTREPVYFVHIDDGKHSITLRVSDEEGMNVVSDISKP